MWLWLGLPTEADLPVDPSAAEARQWALDELSKGIYQSQEGAVRIFDRISRLILDLFGGVLFRDNPWVVVLLVLGISALLVLVVVAVANRTRNSRRVAAPAVVFDDARTAGQYRDGARAALAAGDVARAFLDSFRAIIRSLDERAILDDRTGMTAQEAATLASPAFPTHAGGLAWASTTFDAAYYGKQEVRRADVEHLWQLDAAIAATRPEVRI